MHEVVDQSSSILLFYIMCGGLPIIFLMYVRIVLRFVDLIYHSLYTAQYCGCPFATRVPFYFFYLHVYAPWNTLVYKYLWCLTGAPRYLSLFQL